MKKRKWLKKGLALALSAAMVLGMMPGNVGRTVYAAESEAEQSEENSQAVAYDQEYNIADGSVTIDKAGTYRIYSTDANTSVTNTITVGKDISVAITLENVNIDVSGTKGSCAFKIENESAGKVTVKLIGDNTLKSGEECAGLQKRSAEGCKGILTIEGSGKLTAIGGNYASGIGGDGVEREDVNTSNITIKSGTIIATGGTQGAGIGGGDGTDGGGTGNGHNITIEGGTVVATGGNGANGAAGIGGGSFGNGSNITISGGTVTAISPQYGAGIGGGIEGNGSDITISGGTVSATSLFGGAGIGGGALKNGAELGNGSNITISGGTVTVTGGDSNDYHAAGAGIGGGEEGAGTNIIITGGSVKATPGKANSTHPNEANAIGGGAGKPAVTPTNGTDPVYLLEIENPNASEIQVNGESYTPISHGEEARIYAYLPAGTKDRPNMVTVGDKTKAYWYDVKSAQWDDTLLVVAVPAADETIYTYDGEDKIYRIAQGELYTVTGNVQKYAGEYIVTVSLKNKEYIVWSDGSKEDRKYRFTIGQGTLNTASVEKNIEISCDKTTSKVSDVSLPYNWSWEETDQSKVLEAETEVDVTAVYNGSDKENYTEESRRVTIRITKKAHTDADGDGRCDVEGCGQYADGIGAKLAGYSLSLAGNIGVNFYMELSDAVAADEDAYMNFKLPNGTTSKVYVTGTHADGVTAKKESVTVNGESRKYYVFPCEVAAKEMTADIKAQMVVEEKKGTEYTYTVKDYADYIREHADQYADQNGYSTVYLVNYMLNYGGYAQEYFDYRTDDLANQDLTDDDRDWVKKSVNADTFSYWKATVDNAEEAGTFVSAYLSLKSRTDLCVYVKLADGVDPSEVTFAVDDHTVSPDKLVVENVNGSDCYKLTVPNIAANQLDQMHTFTVTRGSGENEKKSTLQYGAFSYAYTALSSDVASVAKQEELCNTLKAMYEYHYAAKMYFDQHNQ